VLMAAPAAIRLAMSPSHLPDGRNRHQAQRLPNRLSQRRWDYMVARAGGDRVAEIVVLAKQEHPYEVPGISTRTITGGNPEYLAWIAQETTPDQH